MTRWQTEHVPAGLHVLQGCTPVVTISGLSGCSKSSQGVTAPGLFLSHTIAHLK